MFNLQIKLNLIWAAAILMATVFPASSSTAQRAEKDPALETTETWRLPPEDDRGNILEVFGADRERVEAKGPKHIPEELLEAKASAKES